MTTETRVRVYRNLTKGCYSVQDYVKGRGWRVLFHTPSIQLTDVTFKVYETGRQRVIREQQKNVHAYVMGRIADAPVRPCNERVSYNPYKAGHFTDSASQPILEADAAILTPTGVYV